MIKIEQTVKIPTLLNKSYGRPGPFRKTDPVDEIIRTILSQNTNDRNSLAAFADLKRGFRSWDVVLRAPAGRIAATIKHAGLSNIKAKRIKEVLGEISKREGRISLSVIKRMDPEDGLAYLKSLRGVGPKTAACVLLFSFGKPVMPVDTHIFRVANRLGLIGPKVSIEEAHELLTKLVLQGLAPRPFDRLKVDPERSRMDRRGPESSPGPCSGSSHSRQARDLIYEFHLGIIEHGRRTCKALRPGCGACVLYGLCGFKDKRKFAR